jgi:hypothetical protein
MWIVVVMEMISGVAVDATRLVQCLHRQPQMLEQQPMLSPRWQLVWDDGPPVDRVVVRYDVAVVVVELVAASACALLVVVVVVYVVTVVLMTTWTLFAVMVVVALVVAEVVLVAVFATEKGLAPTPFAATEIEPFPPPSLH